MAAIAGLHFNITRQKTTTGPGTQTVLRNRKTLGFVHAQVYCPQEDLIAGAFQLLPDSTCSLSQKFPGIGSPAGQYMIFELVSSGD